jgi:hypothetical protein
MGITRITLVDLGVPENLLDGLEVLRNKLPHSSSKRAQVRTDMKLIPFIEGIDLDGGLCSRGERAPGTLASRL